MILFLSAILTIISSPFPDITYDPEVAALMDEVSAGTLEWMLAGLSGERSVLIEGSPDSIPTRYAYTPQSFTAARWIADQLTGFDLDAEVVPFIPVEFRDLELTPSGTGWACGWNGHGWAGGYGQGIFKTTDFGGSWIPVDTLGSVTWQAVEVISPQVAWIVDDLGRIARTTDGINWRVVKQKELPLYDICSISPDIGWAAGNDGHLYSTADSWDNYQSNKVVDDDLEHVWFVSARFGWIASGTSIWATSDGGENWEYQYHPLIEITDILFTDSSTGYISGETEAGYGAIIQTMDGGETWSPLTEDLYCIPQVLDASGTDSIWAGCGSGVVMFSSDQGQSWETVQLQTSARIDCLDYVSGQMSAAGPEDAFHSPDGLIYSRIDTAGLGLMWNVVATIPGEDSTLVVAIAHLDTRSEDPTIYAPGADDNGSGTVCVMEAARVLANLNPKHTIQLVLVSGEEVGLFGSHRYVNQLTGTRDSVIAVLNVDMFAWDSDADRAVEINSNPDDALSQAAGDILLDVADIYGLDLVPVHYIEDVRYNSDHYYFWKEMIPAVFFTEDRFDFNPFYHTTGDRLVELTPTHIAEGTRAAVGWLVHMADIEELVGIAEEALESLEQVELKISSTIVKSRGSVFISTPFDVTPCIYDASGRRVKELNLVSSSSEPVSLSLDVSALPAGVYWIAVPGSVGQVSQRFVVVR